MDEFTPVGIALHWNILFNMQCVFECTQEKEDPEMAMELRKLSLEYERRRMQMQIHYGNIILPSIYSQT